MQHDSQVATWLEFAPGLADAAGVIARQYFRQPLDVERKADDSPVTLADRAIEAMMRERIRARWPAHGILGEEQGQEHLEREFVWVLDPIDGTKSFISGNPLFGTMICLLRQGRAVLSLVDIPLLGERWQGVDGQGARLNGQPCRVRSCTDLSQAMVMATSPDSFPGPWRAPFEAASGQAALRRFGGDCYAYCLLASGHVDAVFGGALEPYDYLPLAALIESAGGILTDWSGQRPGMSGHDVRVVAAATPALHAQLLAALAV